MIASALAAAADCHQALAHPIRLRFLAALREGRLCVGELQHLSGQALSTVSRHVAELERVGLVELRKEGRWVWCQLATDRTRTCILEHVWRQIDADPTLVRDRQRVSQIRGSRQVSGCAVPEGSCRDAVLPVAELVTVTSEEAE